MYLLPQPAKALWQEGNFYLRCDGAVILDDTGAFGIQKNGNDGGCSGEGISFEPVSYSRENVYAYAKMLQKEIASDTGMELPVRREQGQENTGNILLVLKPAREEEKEAYTLRIQTEGVTIQASGEAGLLYGVQTLRQMLRQGGAVLPCVQIEDAPKILVRGLSYDTSRGRIPTLEELKRQADLLSFYKMNQLQLYVEHSYLFRDFSEVWRRNTALTAEEILELDLYCRRLHIDLVPSLASFGHLYEVLRTKTYERYCELEQASCGSFSLVDRMGHHTLNVSDEGSFSMAAGRIEEFMNLFSTRYFNICGDETFDLCKGKSKALGEEKGVKRVYVDFLKKLCNFVEEKGRIPMYWGDVLLEKPELLPQMSQDAICLNWEYLPEVTEEKVRILADAGVRRLYLCPGVQSWNHLINRHGDAYRNISLMCRNGHKYHAEGILNTEWGDLGHIAPPEMSAVGQIYGAAFSWSDELLPEEEINRRISVLQYGDQQGDLVSLFRDLADTECVNWWHAVQYMEEQSGSLIHPEKQNLDRILFASEAELTEDEVEAKAGELLERGSKLTDRLYEKLAGLPQRARQDTCAYLLMGEGQRLLTLTGLALYRQSKKRKTDHTDELAVALERWLAAYGRLWRRDAKESELNRIMDVICWYADRLREIKLEN